MSNEQALKLPISLHLITRCDSVRGTGKSYSLRLNLVIFFRGVFWHILLPCITWMQKFKRISLTLFRVICFWWMEQISLIALIFFSQCGSCDNTLENCFFQILSYSHAYVRIIYEMSWIDFILCGFSVFPMNELMSQESQKGNPQLIKHYPACFITHARLNESTMYRRL